jgi:opacity protein-like surface antigen
MASPAGAQSTTTTTNDHYMTDIMHALTSKSRWSLSANAATSRLGTFLMQDTPGGERALQADRNVGWGLGAGFDVTDKLNVRLGWSYTNSSMEYRDYNGTGSNLLDIDNLGKLKNNIASLDVMHYFVGSRSLVSPFAGAGIAGVWSALGPETPLLITPGGSQQFHVGINANLGVQVRVIEQVFGRVEWNTMGTTNPFNGNRSYKAPGGTTFDEPDRVNKSEWRLGATYYFGKQAPNQQPTVATSP